MKLKQWIFLCFFVFGFGLESRASNQELVVEDEISDQNLSAEELFFPLDAKRDADIAALRRAIGALAADVRDLKFNIDSDIRAGRGGSYARFAQSDAQQLDFRASDLRRELAYVDDDPHRLRGEIQHFGQALKRLSSRLWHSDWGFQTTNSIRRVERSFQLVESAFRRVD